MAKFDNRNEIERIFKAIDLLEERIERFSEPNRVVIEADHRGVFDHALYNVAFANATTDYERECLKFIAAIIQCDKDQIIKLKEELETL